MSQDMVEVSVSNPTTHDEQDDSIGDMSEGEGRPFYKRNSSTCSDYDYQQALEVKLPNAYLNFPPKIRVIIENEKSSRRKASITDEEAAEMVRQKAAQRSDVACRVHQLLSDHHKLEKANTLTGIREVQMDRRSDRKGSGAGAGPGGITISDNGMRSRMLTKKQLSDMAWGVRELSKRLGAVKLKVRVRNIFLLTKAHDESLIGLTREMTEWLLSDKREGRYTVYVEDTLKANKKFDAEGIVAKKEDGSLKDRLRYWNNQLAHDRPDKFDFVVSLGGDGTVLYASWLFQRIVPPVMSFALGSLGFLTKFDYEQYPDLLTSAFRDGVIVSLRLRFEGTVMRSEARAENERRDKEKKAGGKDDGQALQDRDLVEELVGEEARNSLTHRPAGTYEILNDIVVDRGPNPTMSSIEVFGDDEHYTTVQADGVCVATPTGSTAYNLAAGGSLCHPDNPVILVTAICAHTLSFRPIILPDTMVLRVGVPYDARTSSWASFDGRERVELQPGDYVTISASRYPFANVMPQGRRGEDWVSSISSKLQWNVREKQKSFKEWSKD